MKIWKISNSRSSFAANVSQASIIFLKLIIIFKVSDDNIANDDDDTKLEIKITVNNDGGSFEAKSFEVFFISKFKFLLFRPKIWDEEKRR